MKYKEEYYCIIDDIRYKLSKIYLTNNEMRKYKKKLSQIEAMISDSSDSFTYYEAILKALKIESALSKIINSNKQLILPPYENESFLIANIKSQKNDLKNYQRKLRQIKTSLVSYILTGTIFLTSGAYIITKDYGKPNNRMYLTESRAYYDNVDKEVYSSSYQKENTQKTEVIIKKIMPWVSRTKEVTRQEYIYKISNMSYDEIINLKDYEKIIANLECEEKITTMPIDKFRGIFKYYEPIYEVTETIQKKEKFIEQKRIVSKETILALFGELLIYILFIDLNNKTILDSILIGASDVNLNDKIIDSKRDTLELLKKQYCMTKKKNLKK